MSITDYKLAKDMDIDGIEHIDELETRLGRTKLARNFYETKIWSHQGFIGKIGEKWTLPLRN